MSDLTTDIDSLPPLREVIADHDLRAQKSLGQNFLLDLNVTDKIVRAAGRLESKTVFEIGPGPGGLTRSLLKSGIQKVIAVEFDERAVQALQSLKTAAGNRLEIIQADALKVDLTELSEKPRAIVANLPYNIATPLLIGWLKQIHHDHAFESMTLMFQKEVADRLRARPGDKNYGRLAVLAGWLCNVETVYDLPPSAFTPPPKVSSAVVRLTPRSLPDDKPDFGAIEKLTEAAFGQRRKMIRSSLKDYLPIIESLDIDPTLRAENLSIDDFLEIAKRA